MFMAQSVPRNMCRSWYNDKFESIMKKIDHLVILIPEGEWRDLWGGLGKP